MAANEEDNKNFNEWRLATLDMYIMSLQDQVSHMETDWGVMRDDTMSAAVFNKISQLVDESMATADVALDKAEKFMCLRIDRA